MSKSLTREDLDRVAGLPAREAGRILGVGKSTINDARARFNMKRTDRGGGHNAKPASSKSSKIEDKGDSLLIETVDSVPQTRDHINERMRSRGFDPEQYSFTYSFSEWEAQTPEGVQVMYAAKASATERKKSVAEARYTLDDLIAAIDGHEPSTASEPDAGDGTFVFCFADPQIGKTDLNGGTDETIERFLASLDHAEELLRQNPAREIVWAGLGDDIEGFCNTSSQRQTNDLNLVEQTRVVRRMQMEGILRLSQHAPLTHVTVPSNHSQNRVGFQQPASTSHDDWGIEIQQQLIDAFELAGEDRLANPVTWVAPEQNLESVAYTTPDGTRLGFVHGHRANNQNALEGWWAGQTLGRQPTHDADILLVGHFHNLSVRSVGDQRYIVTTPSLDNGSSWFTVSRGSVATAGVLTLRVDGGRFRDMLIV